MCQSNPKFSNTLAPLGADKNRNISYQNNLCFETKNDAIPLATLARLPWFICQKILKKSSVMFHLYDLREQRNLYVGGCLAHHLGYTRTEIEAMGVLAFASLLHPQDLCAVAAYYQHFSTLEIGKIIEIEYRMKRADGEWCWLRSRETRYLDRAEKCSPRLLGTVREITGDEEGEKTELEMHFFPSIAGGWIEIVTEQPNGTYYIGPFEDANAAEGIYSRYFADLADEIGVSARYYCSEASGSF
jgi:PAS domain S-box-containing protein